MSWRASVETESWPMSSVGKKPFGIAANMPDGQPRRVARKTRNISEAEAQAEVEQRRGSPPAPRSKPRSNRFFLRGCAVRVAGRQARRQHRRQRQRDNAEATIAIVTTTANSLKMRPTTPPMSSTGMNTATSETVIDMMVKPISPRALERRLERRHALLDVADDVLEHDDGVVDDEADRQRQAEQRDVVDRVAEQRTSPPKVAMIEIGTATPGMRVAASRAEEEVDHQDRPARWSARG